MTRGIVALLILSIPMNVKFNLLYSDNYMAVHPGIPINLPGLCIVALYVLWSVDYLWARPKKVCFIPSVTIPFILLTVWAGMSTVFSNTPAWTLYELPGCVQALLLFIYMANFLRSDDDIRFIARCLAVSVALTGALGLLQHFFGSSFDLKIFGGAPELLQETYATGSVSRVSGFLGHANRVAYFLVSILPVVLLSSLWTKGTIATVSLFFASALGLATLVLTFSRGGWGSFSLAILMIAFLLVIRRPRLTDLSRLRIRAAILLVIGCVLVIPFAPTIAARISGDDYDSARTESFSG